MNFSLGRDSIRHRIRRGVIAAVTLQCEPAYALAAAEAPGSLDEVLAELDENLVGNDHFEFYWFPPTRRVLTKRNNRVLPGTELRPVGRFRHWLDDDLLANRVFDRVNRITTRRPALIPRANGWTCARSRQAISSVTVLSLRESHINPRSRANPWSTSTATTTCNASTTEDIAHSPTEQEAQCPLLKDYRSSRGTVCDADHAH